MAKITRGILPLFAAGGAAAALSPDEAEAAPRPKYMEELVEKLKSGDFEPGMDFGEYSARDLKKNGLADNGFTPGPVRLSPKNIAKFDRERIQQNHMSPEEFVDGLNSVLHGTRGRTFPNRDDLRMRLVPETEWEGDIPFVRHMWKGVVAPHDGYSGLVTGYKYKPENAKKDLIRFSGERPSSPFTSSPRGTVTQQGEISAVGEPSQVFNSGELEKPSEGRFTPHVPHPVEGSDTQLKRFSAVESDSKIFDDSNIPEMDALRKGLLPLFAGGAGAAAALAPGEAQAAEPEGTWRDTASARWDEFKRGLGLGTRNVMEGLGEVADTFLNQPINAVGRLFGYDPGLVNPGKGIADAMGLPVPVTDLEKNMALWESGAASAVPLIMSGGAMAKMAASSVARGVGRELSATPRRDIVISGLLSRFLGGD